MENKREEAERPHRPDADERAGKPRPYHLLAHSMINAKKGGQVKIT